MASIRKAKKLGIYKTPKYTKDRAKLMSETRALVDKANRRLKGLKNVGYDKTYASKKLVKRLDTKNLKAITKNGKIKINKTLSNTQLKAIQKATRQFLESKTSTIKGIRDVKRSTLESLRATLSKDVNLTELEIEDAYDMLSNKDFDYFNKEDRIGASTMWALIEDAIEEDKSEEDFVSSLFNIMDFSNDIDAIEKAKRLYDKYVL